MHHHQLFGLVVASPRWLAAPTTHALPDIVIHEHAQRNQAPAPVSAQGYAYAQREDGTVHVTWSDLFDFIVSADGKRIDVYTGAAPKVDDVYTYLITQVMSVALLRMGVETFHGSAVALPGGRAIVVIGESGFGKSTLTAALLQRGAKLITDDLLVIAQRGDAWYALRGATRLKLDPQTAAALGFEIHGTPMIDGSGKHVYAVPPTMCAEERTRIERMVLLAPGADSAQLQSASAARATRAMLAATFNPLHTEPARLARLLTTARDLAESGCVFSLDIPRDLQRIPEAVAALQ